jgi:hypothetical protein
LEAVVFEDYHQGRLMLQVDAPDQHRLRGIALLIEVERGFLFEKKAKFLDDLPGICEERFSHVPELTVFTPLFERSREKQLRHIKGRRGRTQVKS